MAIYTRLIEEKDSTIPGTIPTGDVSIIYFLKQELNWNKAMWNSASHWTFNQLFPPPYLNKHIPHFKRYFYNIFSNTGHFVSL